MGLERDFVDFAVRQLQTNMLKTVLGFLGPKFIKNVAILVARIARPTSLAIWHRRHSHRRPNCSECSSHRQFASLNIEKHADVTGFSWELCDTFALNSEQAKGFSHR